MKTRWQAHAVLSLLCIPLLGCESLDIKHEAAASRNAAFRAEPIADRCERNFRLRPIQSKEDAASWLSKCGNFDRSQTVAEVREAYDRYALAECRTKSEAAQTSAALDKLKYFCGEYLDDPVIQASMGRRSQLETSELLADLDTIGTGAPSYRYQQFLDRHKNISRDNPAVVRAESLLKIRADSERLLEAEQKKKDSIKAYHDSVVRQKNLIAYCNDTINSAERGLLQEQQVGQLTGYVNATRMNFLGRVIIECRGQIESAKTALTALEKDTRRFTSAPLEPASQIVTGSGRRVPVPPNRH